MTYIRAFFDLLRTTFQEWNEDDAPRLAAALAYYTAFSIAPLLVIIIGIVGLVVNQDTVRQEIITQVQGAVGGDAAEMVSTLIDNAAKPADGLISTLLGVGALLLGALGIFANLQASLDIIWDVDRSARPGGIVAFARAKLLSFGMLLIVGFLLLISLVLTTVLSALNQYVLNLLPAAELLAGLLNVGVSFAVTTVLFALIYKFLPSVKLTWRDVWIGAAVTSVLFTIGRTILGSYLGSSSTASVYGAAGAFVLILLWVYYSAQIVLFGAEFAQVYTRRYGSHKVATQPSTVVREQTSARLQLPAVTATRAQQKWSARDLVFGLGFFAVAMLFSRRRD